MKILLTFYSRSNTTKNIAKMIQKELNCDIEEIGDFGRYNGKLGYAKGGMDASASRTCEITEISKNPKDYDLVIIGTPVWASKMAPPIYTYLTRYGNDIKEIASFCTCSSGGYEKTLKNIRDVSSKTPKAEMYLTKKDTSNPEEKIKKFIEMIK